LSDPTCSSTGTRKHSFARKEEKEKEKEKEKIKKENKPDRTAAFEQPSYSPVLRR
jgi:hypothetical protein